MKSMKVMKLNTRNLKDLPESVFEDNSLKELYCNSIEYKNTVEITPENLHLFPIHTDLLKQLENFIGDKDVDVIEFAKLANLIRPTIIDSLKEGGLLVIANRIGELKNLEILDLSNNNLITIPEEIGNLTNLRKLILANNNIKELPNSISKLENMEFIDLTDNPISQIPDVLLQIPKLNEAQEEMLQFKSKILQKIKNREDGIEELDEKAKSIGIHINRGIRIEYALFGNEIIVQP